MFRARFAARHDSRLGQLFCGLSRLMSLAYQKGKLRSIRRKILAKFLARYFVVSLKQHYVKRNLSVRISMRPPTWALAVRQLPSAPPTLRADARVSRHYRALPFPNLGARCKAAHISAMQKKPFLVQVVLGFSFSVGLSQCPFRSRRAACLFNHPPQCHKMSN